MEVENTDPEATMTIRAVNRFSFRPWAVHGGHPCRVAEVILDSGRQNVEVLQHVTALNLKRGVVLLLVTPTGVGGDAATN
jgi:N-methylhydantoinase B